MSDISVKVENLSKRFLVLKRKETALRALKALIKQEAIRRELWVLRDISFEIKKGEKLALVGKNGSGKTTLLRILTGIYDKTSGYVKVEDNPKALFEFWIGLNGDLSVVDNIYLFGAVHGMARDVLEPNLHKGLEMAELYHLRFSPLKELSLGQMQRLALSVFFQINSDFLIFDESLKFVDKGFAQKCEAYFQDLSSSDKTAIMTSQDSSFLRRHCRAAIWLDEGRIRMNGEANRVITEYERSFGKDTPIL